jgi:hypothetical protein
MRSPLRSARLCAPLAAFAPLLWLSLSALQARAFEPLTTKDGALVRWFEHQLEFTLGTAMPEEIDPAELPELVATLFDRWIETPCGLVPEVTYGGLADTAEGTHPDESAPDNVIVFIRDKAAWAALSAYGPGVGLPSQLALTFPGYDAATGRLVDADILINDAHHTFTTAAAPGPGEIRLQTVLLHEIGHFYGLWHSTDQSAVMAASYDVSLDALTQDDIDGACFLYTDVPEIPETAPRSPAGGCAADAVSPALVLGIVALAGQRRRRAAR